MLVKYISGGRRETRGFGRETRHVMTCSSSLIPPAPSPKSRRPDIRIPIKRHGRRLKYDYQRAKCEDSRRRQELDHANHPSPGCQPRRARNSTNAANRWSDPPCRISNLTRRCPSRCHCVTTSRPRTLHNRYCRAVTFATCAANRRTPPQHCPLFPHLL